ncbi:response regulator receiver signal transduction histidine kinase [Calothrix brevissima NIES-22]|nr:response regulator receiver signal transduction histidine kinase [Calothrix brevissima NIES-22]
MSNPPNSIYDSTILIVDDNQTNLKMLSNAIAESGWEILVATDGESAIEQAEYAQPDLILLDVMMPGIDGFKTCQLLKKNQLTQDIPVIFLTALSDKFDKVQGLLIGGVDYITKPFQIEEVLARIQVHLKIRFLTKKLAEQNQQLEQRVGERTQDLSQALEDLKQSQVQLVQQEKLSTLGQLVAGVAHEINNPLGFITGNVDFINNYTQSLITHLRLYQEIYPQADEKIIKNAKLIELEQILQDIPKAISSVNLGLERITEISESLRIFARTDTTHKISFDIHDGIDSTLLILKHRLKSNKQRPEIVIIKNYGDLPFIDCYPGQINQVLMNLIANAIEAFEEEPETPLNLQEIIPEIKISTIFQPESNLIKITVKDNGNGISPENSQQIFQQYFTTKPVGKGTGLGLSISKQIIEDKHQGKIYFNSALGQGTEFIIELPVA